MIIQIIVVGRSSTMASAIGATDSTAIDSFYDDKTCTNFEVLACPDVLSPLLYEPEKLPRPQWGARIPAPVIHRPAVFINRRIAPRGWTGRNYKKGAE